MNIEKTIAYLMGLVDDCIERAVTTQTVPKLGRNTIESHLRAALQCKACPVTLEGYSPSSVAVQIQEPAQLAAVQQGVQPAEGVPAPVPVVDALQSLIEAIQFTPLGVRQIHAMERAREALAATHHTPQGLEQAIRALPRVTYGYKSDGEGRYLTSYESSEGQFLRHADVMAAIAAQAKQGGV